MRLLAVDTALQRLSVAIGEGGEVRAARSIPLPRGHAERLLPFAAEVLDDAGLGYPDLDALAVTLGPGTFTGVRVGLAAVRALALALARPVIGFTTLQVLAVQARPAPDETVLALLDARRDEVYAQAFDHDIRPLAEPRILALDDIAGALPTGPTVVVGTGIRPLRERLPAGLRRARAAIAPEAAHMIGLAHRLDLRGGPSPAPVYLRRPDAKLPGGKMPSET
ncbi:MAG: tRNA (adenosine(37)-N6)-threonylcarbamoyltransferase complex dimerization subunit type 1 TsaB [Alphaproteobacteria bacterium]